MGNDHLLLLHHLLLLLLLLPRHPASGGGGQEEPLVPCGARTAPVADWDGAWETGPDAPGRSGYDTAVASDGTVWVAATDDSAAGSSSSSSAAAPPLRVHRLTDRAPDRPGDNPAWHAVGGPVNHADAARWPQIGVWEAGPLRGQPLVCFARGPQLRPTCRTHNSRPSGGEHTVWADVGGATVTPGPVHAHEQEARFLSLAFDPRGGRALLAFQLNTMASQGKAVVFMFDAERADTDPGSWSTWRALSSPVSSSDPNNAPQTPLPVGPAASFFVSLAYVPAAASPAYKGTYVVAAAQAGRPVVFTMADATDTVGAPARWTQAQGLNGSAYGAYNPGDKAQYLHLGPVGCGAPTALQRTVAAGATGDANATAGGVWRAGVDCDAGRDVFLGFQHVPTDEALRVRVSASCGFCTRDVTGRGVVVRLRLPEDPSSGLPRMVFAGDVSNAVLGPRAGTTCGSKCVWDALSGASTPPMCHVPDIDCEGRWELCSTRCERGPKRIFAVSVNNSGEGRACPDVRGDWPPDCRKGDGACFDPSKSGAGGGSSVTPSDGGMDKEVDGDGERERFPMWGVGVLLLAPGLLLFGMYRAFVHGGTAGGGGGYGGTGGSLVAPGPGFPNRLDKEDEDQDEDEDEDVGVELAVLDSSDESALGSSSSSSEADESESSEGESEGEGIVISGGQEEDAPSDKAAGMSVMTDVVQCPFCREESEVWTPTSNTAVCNICQDPEPREMIVSARCGHGVCRECLERMVYRVQRRVPMELLDAPEAEAAAAKTEAAAATETPAWAGGPPPPPPPPPPGGPPAEPGDVNQRRD